MSALVMLTLAACGGRSSLESTAFVGDVGAAGAGGSGACAPVPCPSSSHWDASACECAGDPAPDPCESLGTGPSVIATFAPVDDFAEGTAVTVHGDSVYWSVRGGKNDSGGVIYRVNRCGGAVTAIASQQIGPTALVASDSQVFWGTIGDDNSGLAKGSVMRAPAGGGEATEIAKGAIFLGGIAVDATSVYWAPRLGPFGAWRAPVGGGAPVALVTDQVFGHVAVDATRVFLSQPALVPANSRLLSVPLAGGEPTVLVSSGVSVGGVMTIDATSLYYATSEPALVRLPKAGGSPLTLAPRNAAALAVDDADLYWLESSIDTPPSIRRVPRGGGTTTIVASGGAVFAGLALDASAVYWLRPDGVVRQPK